MFPSWSNTEMSKEEERLGEGRQQKGFMKDLALIPRRGEDGPTARRARCPDKCSGLGQDLVTGKGSPGAESVHLHQRSNFPGLFQVLLLGARLGGRALKASPTVERHSSTHRHKTGLKGFYPEVVINHDIILNVYTALALKLTPLPAPYKPGRQDCLPFCG